MTRTIVGTNIPPGDEPMLRNKLHIILDLMVQMAVKGGDPEHAHSVADDLLVDTILVLGSYAGKPATVRQIVETWQRVEKWYS